jgi:hypothetical protein
MVLGEPKALTMSLRLAIGIPVAQGDADPSNNTPGEVQQGFVQHMASAANGWRDPELYEPKRLPITPGFIMRYQRKKLQAGGEVKVVVMPKIGGEINDPGEYGTGALELRTLGLFAFLGGDVAYDVLGEKYIGLRGWMVWRTVEPIHFETDATGDTPFQFGLEPRIFAKFGIFTPSVGLVVPLGGQLGGEIMGLRLHGSFVF